MKREGDVSSEDSDSDSNDEDAIVLEENTTAATAAAAADTGEVVQVEFSFCDFRNEDCGMVKALLTKGVFGSIPKVNQLLNQLEEQIVQQKAVGTTIRVDDQVNQGEVYSFATILPYSKVFKNSELGEQLSKYLLSSCPADQVKELEEVLNHPQTGLLVNERIVNVPRQVAQPLHRYVINKDFLSILLFCFKILPRLSGLRITALHFMVSFGSCEVLSGRNKGTTV